MGDINLKQAVGEYKDIYLAYRNFAPRTRVEYVNDIEDMVKYLDGVGVSKTKDLNLPHLVHYFAELEKRGFTGSTRKRKTISIRSFLSFLHMENYILSDVGKRLIPPYVESWKPKVLTIEESNRLLNCSKKNIRDYAIIQLLLQTGIKLSELVNLRLRDFIKDAHGQVEYLWISGKQKGKDRSLALSNDAINALSKYVKCRRSSDVDHCFLNRSGFQLGKRGAEKVIEKYMKLAGIKNRSVKSLRHTFGINLGTKGVSLKQIGKIMGIRDPRSLNIYN
jgi:integrase/recombinase XerD